MAEIDLLIKDIERLRNNLETLFELKKGDFLDKKSNMQAECLTF